MELLYAGKGGPGATRGHWTSCLDLQGGEICPLMEFATVEIKTWKDRAK